MREILVLQKPEVLDAQRALVEGELTELDGARVQFATSLNEVAGVRAAEILITPTFDWLPEALERLPNLQWIHFLSAGVDRIWEMDVDWGRYRLSKSSGVHASTISEYVLGAILWVLKGFGVFQRQQGGREWNRFWLDECAGKTLGIVGVGTIGSTLAGHAKRLGMRVVGTVTEPRDIPDVDAVYATDEVEEVLRVADLVVLLVPLTEKTRGVIGTRELGAMKDSAWLVNVSRGEVVDEAALIEALQAGTIGGAVLDVFEEEPLSESSPLWGLQNVLITPHVAGTTQHYMARALAVFKTNYRSLQETDELTTPVSVEKGY